MSTLERTPLSKRDRTLIAAFAEAVGDVLGDRLAPEPVEEIVAPPEPWQDVVNLPQAIGQDLVWTVQGCGSASPLSVMVRLTTSAAIADRSVAVEYRSNGVRYVVSGCQAVVQAGGQQSYCFFVNAGDVAWPIEDTAIAPLADQQIAYADQIAVKVWNGQAGDVLDQGVLVARFYP